MANFSYKFTIKARDQKEANQKMRAFQALGKALDGETLTQIADHLPEILEDETLGEIIEQFLSRNA